jgi:hypothetical protein
MCFDFMFTKISHFNCFLSLEYLLSRHLSTDLDFRYKRLLSLIIITDEYFVFPQASVE